MRCPSTGTERMSHVQGDDYDEAVEGEAKGIAAGKDDEEERRRGIGRRLR